MAATAPSEPQWSDRESPKGSAAPKKPSLLARVARAIGDVGLIIGMSKGGSTRGSPDNTAISNVMLFGEGDAQGREENRGSDPRG
jgi:hypothetical protein